MPVQLRSGARRGRANPNPSTKPNRKATRITNPTIDPLTEGPVTRGRAKRAAVPPAPAGGGRKKKLCDERPLMVTRLEEEEREEVGEGKMNEFDSAGSGDKGNAAVEDEGSSNTPLPEAVGIRGSPCRRAAKSAMPSMFSREEMATVLKKHAEKLQEQEQRHAVEMQRLVALIAEKDKRHGDFLERHTANLARQQVWLEAICKAMGVPLPP